MGNPGTVGFILLLAKNKKKIKNKKELKKKKIQVL